MATGTTTLNMAICEGGTYSSCTYNLTKSQNYRGLKLLLSEIECMTTVDSMLIYHRFERTWCVLMISARHMLVSEQCQVPIHLVVSIKCHVLQVNCAKCQVPR